MPTSLLEIVDLGDGEIVLQRAEDSDELDAEDNLSESVSDAREEVGGGEPLVTIKFSDETRMYIMDQGLEVAKAMIQAGIQAAASIAEQAEVEADSSTSDTVANPASRVLH